MDLYRSIRAVSRASGPEPIDWEAVREAAHAATGPGSIALDETDRTGYRDDVRAARAGVRSVSGIDFDLPPTFQVHNRHHWIDANIETFERMLAPIAERRSVIVPDVARVLNTGSMTVTVSFLARHVLGQYDPLLLTDEPDHGLYFVHPNVVRVADELDVPFDRFRRWIAFHEVAHAAEFGAAPWLPEQLETHLHEMMDALAAGRIDRETFRELDATMTAVEGYAELLMDEAFDQRYDDLRDRIEQRRRNRGPIGSILRRLLGLGIKRRQYERGKAFFDAVRAERGIEATARVWDDPHNLPRWDEYDAPEEWIARVDP